MNAPANPALPTAAEQQGLFRKFDVRRTDGSSKPGGKHEHCEYFVLDVDHDPCARPALAAYAAAVESTHPVLATDMRDRYGLNAPDDTAKLLRASVEMERLREVLAAAKVLVDRDLRYSSGWLDTGLIKREEVLALRDAIASAEEDRAAIAAGTFRLPLQRPSSN